MRAGCVVGESTRAFHSGEAERDAELRDATSTLPTACVAACSSVDCGVGKYQNVANCGTDTKTGCTSEWRVSVRREAVRGGTEDGAGAHLQC